MLQGLFGGQWYIYCGIILFIFYCMKIGAIPSIHFLYLLATLRTWLTLAELEVHAINVPCGKHRVVEVHI
jgi:hypothetical protein